MEKFWLWLRNKANAKVREAHMVRVGHERLCVKCNTWTSEVGGCAALVYCPTNKYHQLMTCKRCGHVSRWDIGGMMPELIPEDNEEQT